MTKQNSNKMLKIVYFDEISAADYLIIKNEGITENIKKQINSKNNEKELNIEGSLWTKLPLILLGIGGKAKGEGKIKIENNENNIIQKTISNSLLSDFIKEIEKDSTIKQFKNYHVSPQLNSMTFIKIFTPYLKMITNEFETDGVKLNFSNMDDAFEDGKGYYEMIAQNENEKNIFRFNIKSFRNNYTLADLTKMNLCYFGIKVGEIEEKDLDINNELCFPESSNPIQLEDLEEPESTSKQNTLLEIYDILLAGVDTDGN